VLAVAFIIMNIDFIKEILMSTAEFWIVAKKTEYTEYFETKRDKDQIVFIAIPKDIKRGLKYEEITLQEVEKLHRACIEQNIFINTDYPPFQQYITFGDMYKGYPIEHKTKEFLLKALDLKSNELYEYKALIEVSINVVTI
jgi:hypothetical protein